MRIGLVCPYNMFEHYGGVQQLVTHLSDGLAKKGHHVKIITPRPVKFHGEVPENYTLLGTSRKVRSGLSTVGDVTFEIDGNQVEAVLENEKLRKDLIEQAKRQAAKYSWRRMAEQTLEIYESSTGI